MKGYLSALDFRLGWRALRKYPVLNLVAGAAIAFAITCAAVVFEGVTQALYPRLPLPDGSRVVGIRLWNAASGRAEERSLYYYARWRDALRTVHDLGAFAESVRSLADSAGHTAPVSLASITASGLRVARVAPRLGRAFAESDERVGAAPVIILGHDVWQERFAGDPHIVGRGVRLGGELRTVVGVMPAGFLFPIRHNAWVPLQAAVGGHDPGEGPSLRLLGRLAPGATLADAERELAVSGARAARDAPAAYARVAPQVMPYARSIVYVPSDAGLGFRAAHLFTVLLLALCGANVGLLVFARAATRENEIVVRNALGATRRRIVAQLFAESLVLAAVAAAVGLAVAEFGTKWAFGVMRTAVMRPPFWFHDTLSATTVAYGAALALLSAVLTGALPGLKVTRDLGVRLRAGGAGGGGVRLGRGWGVVVAAQVTVAVLFPVATHYLRRDVVSYRALDLGYPAADYFVARLAVDAEGPQTDGGVQAVARATALYRALQRRVAAQPGVTAVTFADRVAGSWHPRVRIELDAAGTPLPDTVFRRGVSVASVDADYFEALGASVRAGRGFRPADVQSGARVVVVNESFVRNYLRGRNPSGWHLRYPNPDEPTERRRPDQAPGPWYEIVGVVPDLAMHDGGRDPRPFPGAGFYHVAEPGRHSPVHMAVRVRGRGSGETFARQLYLAGASVDPRLRVEAIFRGETISQHELTLPLAVVRLSVVLGVMALLISSAAIYAVTAFDVRRRTREIGVRVALGSVPRRVVRSVIARPFAQVGSGVLVGTLLTLANAVADHGTVTPGIVAAVLAYDTLMLAVCMLGCLVPTLRALHIKPMEALRTE